MLNTLVLVALVSTAADPLKPGDHSRSLEVRGRTRDYLIHVPEKLAQSKSWPVVLAFHGGGVNAESMIGFSGLNETADREGFLVVYPNGTGRLPTTHTWNGGNCCGYAMTQNVNDVAFVAALLDDLATVAPLDVKRVYATGMSNGGILAYRLASELADRIAAIAPVGGPMGTETCSPKQPVSVIHFHGSNDQYAPLKGGQGTRSLSKTNFYSVDHSVQAWINANGCPAEPETTTLPDKAGDGTTITRKVWGPGRDGSEVVLYVIEGGGHTWPGRQPRLEILGKSTKNISANDLMWEFFKKHPRK